MHNSAYSNYTVYKLSTPLYSYIQAKIRDIVWILPPAGTVVEPAEQGRYVAARVVDVEEDMVRVHRLVRLLTAYASTYASTCILYHMSRNESICMYM